MMDLSVPIITVDGPSGSGKGTVCTLLAAKLGYSLLDSGALYRLTALSAMNQGLDLHSEQTVQALALNLDVKFDVDESLFVSTILAGENVSTLIRREDVGMNASVVAALPLVREALLMRQRAFAQSPGLVADGRDMGTVVFPDAPVKIFLTASAKERADRRFRQLELTGGKPNFESILADIIARDERDTSRAAAPLRPAADALVLDSTDLSIEQVLEIILEKVSLKVASYAKNTI